MIAPSYMIIFNFSYPFSIVNDDDDDEDDNKMFLEMAMERVMRGAEASLTVLNIMTSKKMSKRVYVDDVIDRVALFLRFQVKL